MPPPSANQKTKMKKTLEERKQASRDAAALWRKKNSGRVKEYGAEYRKLHRQELRDSAKASRLKNPMQTAAMNRFQLRRRYLEKPVPKAQVSLIQCGYRKLRNKKTLESASSHFGRWTPEEDEFLIAFSHSATAMELARTMRRTLTAIMNRRAALRRRGLLFKIED